MPRVPASFSKDVLVAICDRKSDVLFLNGSLSFIDDIAQTLKLIDSNGYSTIVIHDVPIAQSIHYESNPEIEFFTIRNKRFKEKTSLISNHDCFEVAIKWAKDSKWKVICDDNLTLDYASPS